MKIKQENIESLSQKHLGRKEKCRYRGTVARLS
jgi:hypothetical protein